MVFDKPEGMREAAGDFGEEVAAKEKGLIRLEGKEYVVNDGDAMVFRFA